MLRARAFCRSAIQQILARRNLTLGPADKVGIGLVFVHAIYRRLGIDLVLDVGANTGRTAQELRSSGYTGRIVSFEPQQKVFDQLQTAAKGDNLWECRRTALGTVDGVFPIEVSGLSESSSFLPMDLKHIAMWPTSQPIGREDVPVARLDTLASELGVANARTLLKIDAQGYELAILQGAETSLPHVTAAYVELLFSPLYKGQAKYFEVMAALDAAGLQFVGLYEHYADEKTGFPLFANGLFVRSQE